MDNLWTDPAFRAAVVIIFAQVVASAVKKYKPALEGNKTVLRCTVSFACLVGAVIADWLPDGIIVVGTVWTIFWQSLLGAEMTYQWLVKYVAGWELVAKPAKKASAKKKKK